MHRILKKLSQNCSLSKLRIAFAAVSFGAALLAPSYFAFAQQSQVQTCDAGQVVVAAPVPGNLIPPGTKSFTNSMETRRFKSPNKNAGVPGNADNRMASFHKPAYMETPIAGSAASVGGGHH